MAKAKTQHRKTQAKPKKKTATQEYGIRGYKAHKHFEKEYGRD